MEIPFHDPFNGDATSAFDDPDALGFFWDELNAGDLTQPCPQSTDPPTEPHTLQQQEEEEDECQDGKSKWNREASSFYKNGMAPPNHLWTRCATL
ncbi:hypothetical protein KC349_g9178 [Hortaea werneckii]|nr:hypothetical protein KC349_g9178 [Hortaea werneckii]